jgi:hypothetical protein
VKGERYFFIPCGKNREINSALFITQTMSNNFVYYIVVVDGGGAVKVNDRMEARGKTSYYYFVYYCK